MVCIAGLQVPSPIGPPSMAQIFKGCYNGYSGCSGYVGFHEWYRGNFLLFWIQSALREQRLDLSVLSAHLSSKTMRQKLR